MNGSNARILINITLGLGVLIIVLILIFSLRQPESEKKAEVTGPNEPSQFTAAVGKRDPALCQGLAQDAECMLAVEASRRDDLGMQGCYDLESQGEFRICHDSFLIKQASESKDPEVCKQAIYSNYQEECELAAK